MTIVTTIEHGTTRYITKRRRSSTMYRWFNRRCPAIAKERLVLENATWLASSKMAEVLANVRCTPQCFPASLQTHVHLVVTIVEAGTTDNITPMVSTCLLHLADLRTKHLYVFTANDVPPCAFTTTITGYRLKAWAARPIVAWFRTRMIACVAHPTAAPTTKGKRIRASGSLTNPTHKKRCCCLSRTMASLPTSASIAPRQGVSRTKTTFPFVT